MIEKNRNENISEFTQVKELLTFVRRESREKLGMETLIMIVFSLYLVKPKGLMEIKRLPRKIL